MSDDPRLPPAERQILHDAAWLVSRGVRILATVEPTADAQAVDEALAELRAEALDGVTAFVLSRSDGRALRGYASHPWAVDLAAWLIECGDALPRTQKDRVWGLLHGYSAEAIASYENWAGPPPWQERQ